MNYLTNYYKSLCEDIQRKINGLEKQLLIAEEISVISRESSASGPMAGVGTSENTPMARADQSGQSQEQTADPEPQEPENVPDPGPRPRPMKGESQFDFSRRLDAWERARERYTRYQDAWYKWHVKHEQWRQRERSRQNRPRPQYEPKR